MADSADSTENGAENASGDVAEDQNGQHQSVLTTQEDATTVAATAVVPDARCRRQASAAHGGALAWVLVGGAVGVGALLLARLHGRRRGCQKASVRREELFTSVVSLRQPSVAQESSAAALLAGKTFAVSDRFDVQGISTRAGCDAWQAERQICAVSAPAVDLLLFLGATGEGTVPTQSLGLGPLPLPSTLKVSNPAARGRVLGGGEFGAAAAVAAGLADLALAVDELGSALVPAASCGAFAFRPTAGVLPLEGAGASAPTLSAVCLLARDPRVLLRAGRGLQIPGATAGGVANYLVAEDLFGVCGEEVQRAAPAVVAAVRRWAGPEQAQGLSLCEWLFHRIPTLQTFMPQPEGGNPAEQLGPSARTEEVLEALAAAALAVQRWEWSRSSLGRWALAHRGQLSKQAAEVAAAAEAATEAQYRAGIAVAEELSAGMRAALQQGYVFVLPTAPGPPPRQGSGSKGVAAQREYHRRCLQFAALASLAGVPQVAMPMPSPRGPPLSISLVTLQRKDMVLLQAADKLGSLLAEEAAAREPPAAKANKPTPAAGRSRGGGQGFAAELSAEELAAAEAARERGNAAFNAKRYSDAARWYSESIRRAPSSHVYYSNRAMANLKLGMYSAAEADCDAALKLDPAAVKALLRRGSARLAQGDMSAAKQDFVRVLQLEPRNRQAAEELARLRPVASDGGGGGSGSGGQIA